MDYHSGELSIQRQAGVQAEAARLASRIGDFIYPKAADFLRQQQFAVTSSVSETGKVWASLLVGTAGFISVISEKQIQVESGAIATDMLRQHLMNHSALGLLAMDFENRRRLRLHGSGAILPSGHIELTTNQVYFNCPKYIQSRSIVGWREPLPSPEPLIGTSLSAVHQQLIESSDTFFIASLHPEKGADISHRGGNPGFVRCESPDVLMFPDYVGNNMFNTLGNLAVYDQAGLLFLDFEQGDILQLIGTTILHWDTTAWIDTFPGAERMIEYHIHQVRSQSRVCPLQWQLIDLSPYNP